jgi:hypothetical protein
MAELTLKFSGEVIYWRGPAPFHFVAVPEAQAAKIKAEAARLTYGWGVIPATVKIGKTEFTTSLFPKNGGYLVPIKNIVRLPEKIEVGDVVAITLKLGN